MLWQFVLKVCALGMIVELVAGLPVSERAAERLRVCLWVIQSEFIWLQA